MYSKGISANALIIFVYGIFTTAQGTGRRTAAGHISGLIQQAADLHPDSKDDPIICIESDVG